MMPKRIIMLVVIILLLSACSAPIPESEPITSTPTIVASTQPDAPSFTPPVPPDVPSPVSETPALAPVPALDYIPTIRVSTSLEEGCTIMAAVDRYWITEPVYVYVYTNQPINDMLVSELYVSTGNEPIETDGILYVPELMTGQAIKLLDPYPEYLSDTENHLTKIAYTNSDGEYEVVVLHNDQSDKSLSLIPMEHSLSEKRYDEYCLGNEQFIIADLLSAEFKEKTLAGDFDDYVPKGFRIAGGKLGDVNGDGIEDALMYLLTDGRRVAAYAGVMPLFVLIGQSNGGYIVEKKIAEALFWDYRSSSYPVAGNGGIDIVYDYVGGAGCHHTQVCRFLYVPDKNDWFLSAFYYQPSYTIDGSEALAHAFVRPMPSMSDLPIEKLTGNEYDRCLPDWDYFDEVCEFTIPSLSEYYKIYTLVVKLDKATGYYEGYVYLYYESANSGGFIQTIRGEYSSDTKLEVIANAEDRAFIVQGDIWKMNEYDSDAFYLCD